MLLTVPVKKAIIAFKKGILITGISIDKVKHSVLLWEKY